MAPAGRPKEDENYLLCRRCVRVWPVIPDSKGLIPAVKVFLRDVMEMPTKDVLRIPIETAEATASPPNSKIHDEVLVCFKRVEDRDTVYSYARSLAKTGSKAGIRLEIPQHLRTAFRLLETHANAVRAAIGPTMKRSIRFDDVERSMVLSIKLSEHDPWITIDATQAGEARRLKNENAIKCIKNVYDMAEPIQMSSPATKALGLWKTRPRGNGDRNPKDPSVDPSREQSMPSASRSNPFGDLRDDDLMDSMSETT